MGRESAMATLQRERLQRKRRSISRSHLARPLFQLGFLVLRLAPLLPCSMTAPLVRLRRPRHHMRASNLQLPCRMMEGHSHMHFPLRHPHATPRKANPFLQLLLDYRLDRLRRKPAMADLEGSYLRGSTCHSLSISTTQLLPLLHLNR